VSNIVFEIANLDAWSEEELYLKLGEPVTAPIITKSGDHPGPSVPDYLVEPINFFRPACGVLIGNIRIIDFGIAFFLGSPVKFLGTPSTYKAPEAWFEEAADFKTDIWALACTIYAIRSGKALLQMY
jgi:serine/threonine-protein kinase SRPK3